MSNPFLIDKILPARQVHILCGPSGVGKTRWLNWMYKDWHQGLPVLGYESFPVPSLYLAKDRNIESLKLTLKSINCEHMMKYESIMYRKDIDIENLKDHWPDIKLFFIDPIAKFVKDGKINDYGAVSDFLTKCSYYCQKDDFTIMGSCHAPKAKEGQLLINPREWTLGSGAWGGYSETMFAFNGDDFKTPNSIRYFYVLARNAPDTLHYFRLKDGWVTLVDDPKEQNVYDLFIASIPEGIPQSRSDLVRLASVLGANVNNFDRDYLKPAQKDGYLSLVRHGHYTKVTPS